MVVECGIEVLVDGGGCVWEQRWGKRQVRRRGEIRGRKKRENVT
jgi:hypothetical protein